MLYTDTYKDVPHLCTCSQKPTSESRAEGDLLKKKRLLSYYRRKSIKNLCNDDDYIAGKKVSQESCFDLLNESEDCKCPSYLINNQIVFAISQRCPICIHQLHKAHAKSSLRLIPSCKQKEKSLLEIVLFTPVLSMLHVVRQLHFLLYSIASQDNAMELANFVIHSRKSSLSFSLISRHLVGICNYTEKPPL